MAIHSQAFGEFTIDKEDALSANANMRIAVSRDSRSKESKFIHLIKDKMGEQIETIQNHNLYIWAIHIL